MRVINSWKYDGGCARPKGTLAYSYLLNGELNTVLVWKIYLEVYVSDQLIDPRLKNILHHLILRIYPQLLAWAK